MTGFELRNSGVGSKPLYTLTQNNCPQWPIFNWIKQVLQHQSPLLLLPNVIVAYINVVVVVVDYVGSVCSEAHLQFQRKRSKFYTKNDSKDVQSFTQKMIPKTFKVGQREDEEARGAKSPLTFNDRVSKRPFVDWWGTILKNFFVNLSCPWRRRFHFKLVFLTNSCSIM